MNNLTNKGTEKGRSELHEKYINTFPMKEDSIKPLTLVMGIDRVLLRTDINPIPNYDSKIEVSGVNSLELYV